MKTITLIRHGESLANAGGITMPNATIPLTDLGHRQAKIVAESLDFVPLQIFVSAYLRAKDTAQAFADKFQLEAQIHPSLHEFSAIDPKMIEGMNAEQRRPFTEEYWRDASLSKRMGVEAETFAEFHRRVEIVENELANFPDKTLLVGHGIWFSLLIWKLLGFTMKSAQDMLMFRKFMLGFPMPNCAVYSLIQYQEGGKWLLEAHPELAQKVASMS